MKVRKQILAVLLTLCMMLTFVPFSTFATSTDEVVIGMEETWAAAGTSVKVDISVSNNPGIIGGTLTVSWPEELTLTDDESGSAFEEITYQPPSRYLNTGTNFVWYGSDVTEILDGTILSLTFEIPENATDIDEYPITITGKGFSDVNENVVGNISYVSDCIRVLNYVPGDVSGDGIVSPTDLVALARYISDGCITDPEGYNITLNELAADVNDDGEIAPMDLILISRYISDDCVTDPNGYNIKLLPSTPKCQHSMEATEKVDATCTEDGKEAYWHCTECDKYYSDEAGKNEISLEDTVIPAGHTLTHYEAKAASETEEGCIEHWKCSVCENYYANSSATEELSPSEVIIPVLERIKSTVVYNVYGSDPYLQSVGVDNSMNPTTFYSADGLVLNDIVAPAGYTWKGWTTADGTPISEIAPHTTSRQIVLNANWEKKIYTISFASDMMPVENINYTTDQEIKLPSPTLDKYTFVGWSDKDGNIYDVVPAGTVGDINLYANWASNRNRAVAVDELKDPIILEDSDNGLMLFTYEIGEIENVPLFTTMNLNCVNGIITEHSKTNEKSISNEQAKTVAQTISNATTNSSSWTLSKDWNNTTEVSQSYLDQTQQTREEAEALAKSQSSSYNIGTSFGGSNTITKSNSNSYKLSGNESHSTTNTTETGQDFALSVDGKFSHEMSAGLDIGLPIEGLDAGISAGRKTSFELGAGVDYSNYVKNTTSGTDSWSNSVELAGEKSSSLTASKNWNTSEGYSSSNSTSITSSISNTVSKLISQQYGYGESYSEGGSNSESQDFATTDSKSDEFSSTMTYYTSDIESTTTSYTSTGNTVGDYRLVMAGNVHVFAVVGYDVAKKSYFVYTYNVLDDTTEEYLDYSFDGSFDDYETSIIPFEVPVFVNEYVNNRIAMTNGLRVDPDLGLIDKYTVPEGEDPATIISVPSYVSVDNNDGTYKSVKITDISSDLFQNNTEVVGVILGHHIKKIPDNAFEGCTSLKYVICQGVTEIGNNAFKGCTALEKFTLSSDLTSLGDNAFEGVPQISVTASNKDVALATASSGANNILLDISYIPTEQSDGLKLIVPEIDSFELQGKDKEYENLSLESDATTTIINGVKINETNGIALNLSSENVTLNRVTVNSSGYAMLLTADTTNITVNGNNSLTTDSGNTLVCRNINLSPLSTNVVGKISVSGTILICGEIQGTEYITYDDIVYLDEEQYSQYAKGVFEITLDANGGTIETENKTVIYGEKVGELPTPTRENFTFDGWHTEDGTEVTADTVFTTANDVTLRAYWISDWVLDSELPEDGEVVNTKWTYNARTTSNSATAPDGYAQYKDSTWVWGSYGSWSAWSRTQYTASDSRKVESKTVTDRAAYTNYKYYIYRTSDGYGYGTQNYYTGSSHGYCTIYDEINLTYALSVHNSSLGTYGPYNSSKFSHSYDCYWFSGGSSYVAAATHKEYRYADRSKVYTYYYQSINKLDSTTEVTASDTIANVEKMVQYRVK